MERRSESRLSVELPGSVRIGDAEAGSMFFSQISSKGCKLTAEELSFAVGATVELYLGPVGPVEGIVRWVRDNSAGVEFDVALDAAVVGYFGAFINDAA